MYVLVCISVCIEFAILDPGRQSYGADPLDTVKDNSTCEARCRAEPTCISYQINTNPGITLCWVQMQSDPFNPSNMFNQPNVVEFVKTNCTSSKFFPVGDFEYFYDGKIKCQSSLNIMICCQFLVHNCQTIWISMCLSLPAVLQ